MAKNTEYDLEYAQAQLGRRNSALRRFIKGFYLRNLLKDVEGPSIDFGCGAGQILELLPAGSIGLEVNEHLVSALREKDLNVQSYNPEEDQLTFSDLPKGVYETFIMSHVLEHFENAQTGLKKILDSCTRLGIKKVIIVVPTEKGYQFDETHRTFINESYLQENGLSQYGDFKLTQLSYFPINSAGIGKFMTFHEMKIVFRAH